MVYVIYTRSGAMVTKPAKIQKEYKQIRNAVRGSFVLFPILGVTWILGAFIIDLTAIFFIYLYNILNSLQGVFVFVVFCLLDIEIKEAGRKLISKYRPTQNTNRVNIMPMNEVTCFSSGFFTTIWGVPYMSKKLLSSSDTELNVNGYQV